MLANLSKLAYYLGAAVQSCAEVAHVAIGARSVDNPEALTSTLFDW